MVGRNKVYDLHTLVVEERPEDDLKLRRTLRSAELSTVRAANLEVADSREAVGRMMADSVEQGDLKSGVSAALLHSLRRAYELTQPHSLPIPRGMVCCLIAREMHGQEAQRRDSLCQQCLAQGVREMCAELGDRSDA
jgi:hypothetical protein